MTSSAVLAAIVGLFPGPVESGTGCGPWAWSEGPLEGLRAPAGMVRSEEIELEAAVDATGDGPGSVSAAASLPMGGLVLGGGAGTEMGEGSPDTIWAAAAAAVTVRGDPIGFMEGVFGPSISVGATLGYAGTGDSGEEPGRDALEAGVSAQISVFPTVAVGAGYTGLTLIGDDVLPRSLGYGATSVFTRELRGHLSVRDRRVSVGLELDAGGGLTVRSGADDRAWRAGADLEAGPVLLAWAVRLSEGGARHSLGVSLGLPSGGGAP